MSVRSLRKRVHDLRLRSCLWKCISFQLLTIKSCFSQKSAALNSKSKARKLNWNTLPQRATRSYTATFSSGVSVDHWLVMCTEPFLSCLGRRGYRIRTDHTARFNHLSWSIRTISAIFPDHVHNNSKRLKDSQTFLHLLNQTLFNCHLRTGTTNGWTQIIKSVYVNQSV